MDIPSGGSAYIKRIRINEARSGTGSKTTILVHGYTCDEATWTEQVAALAKQYRVVTLDLPGHGKSDSPKDGSFHGPVRARD